MSPPVSLVSLASALVTELPCLIERTLKHSVENNLVEKQLITLEVQIDVTKNSITTERVTQRNLLDRIKEIRGPLRTDSVPKSPSLIGFSFETSIPSVCAKPDQPLASYPSTSTTTSLLFPDSPVSLRTKRKGIVFSDDVRVTKKIKTDTNDKGGSNPASVENDCPAIGCL